MFFAVISVLINPGRIFITFILSFASKFLKLCAYEFNALLEALYGIDVGDATREAKDEINTILPLFLFSLNLSEILTHPKSYVRDFYLTEFMKRTNSSILAFKSFELIGTRKPFMPFFINS